MVKKKANTRHRMSKLEKFYIDHHMDSDAKSLAIELGIPEAVIDRYQKKVKRDSKKDDDKENAEPTAQNKTDKVSSILAGLNNPKRITTGAKSAGPGNFAEQQKRLKEAEQKRLAGIS